MSIDDIAPTEFLILPDQVGSVISEGVQGPPGPQGPAWQPYPVAVENVTTIDVYPFDRPVVAVFFIETGGGPIGVSWWPIVNPHPGARVTFGSPKTGTLYFM